MRIRTFIFSKLCRDKTIERMSKWNCKLHLKELSDTEYNNQLRLKLLEEADEVQEANSREELVEEIADVLEVLDALCKANAISQDEVTTVQTEKRKTRGGFDNRIFVTTAELPEDCHWVDYYVENPKKYPEIKKS